VVEEESMTVERWPRTWSAIAGDSDPTDVAAAARHLWEAQRDLLNPSSRQLLGNAPLDMLLQVFLTEDASINADRLMEGVPSPRRVATRWVDYMKSVGLLDPQGSDLVLTAAGFRLVVEACQPLLRFRAE
jgi:hypothetical protein